MSNIVRGNVIGTSLKPELNLLKATNLTPEEQAEVRKNIGANTLIVGAKTTHSPNMDASLGRSTHTPAEIYEHVQNGGTAMFRDDGIYYGLSFSDESTALFCSLFDDNSATVFEVYNDMVYRYDHSFVTDSSFREALEEVRGSVESANKSDTHLVRVNSRLDPDTDERTYETVNFDWDELVDAVNSGKHIYCQVHDMDMLEEDDFVVIEEYALEYFSDEENFATFMKPFLPGYIVRTVEVYFDGSVSCLERTSSVTTDKLLQDPGVPADAEAVGDALAEVYTTIGDISIALDAIIDKQRGLMRLITFTIDGVEYAALDGMSWDEWCNSEYNTSTFYTTETTSYVSIKPGSNIIIKFPWGAQAPSSLSIVPSTPYITGTR